MLMLLIYLIVAVAIAWGIIKDISREETWMLGFGKIDRRDKPGAYWLTILLRGFILVVIIVTVYLRSVA